MYSDEWKQLSSEIRALWDEVPLSAARLDPKSYLVAWVGRGDADLALTQIVGVVDLFRSDLKVGALAAALGLHPGVSGNTTQRMSDYGEIHLEPTRDYRTVREWANDAADMLARQFVEGPSAGASASKVWLDIHPQGDGLAYCQVQLLRPDSAFPTIVMVSVVHDELDRRVVLHTYDRFGSVGTLPDLDPVNGFALWLEWFGVYRPRFSFGTRVPGVAGMSVDTFTAFFSLQIHTGDLPSHA